MNNFNDKAIQLFYFLIGDYLSRKFILAMIWIGSKIIIATVGICPTHDVVLTANRVLDEFEIKKAELKSYE